MRKIFELLRLQAEGLSVRQMSASLGLARSTVSDYLSRIEHASLSWPLGDDVDESQLLERLFGPESARRGSRPAPVWSRIHTERQRPGVTLQLLWFEYKEAHPDGYQYSRFCELYGRWRSAVDPVLRQPHKAGERVFVDYAGQTVEIVDQKTGEVRNAQIFVATLGASNYIFAEATWTQSLPDWIASHERLYRHLGGVPALTVPDYVNGHIIDAYDLDHATQVAEGTFVKPQECLQVLIPDSFFVAMAGMTQCHAEHPGTAPLTCVGT